MSENRETRFLVFPLAALAFGSTVETRLRAIFHRQFFEKGFEIRRGWSPAAFAEHVKAVPEHQRPFRKNRKETSLSDTDYEALIAGMKIYDRIGGNAEFMREDSKELDVFCLGRPKPYCRIRLDIFLDALDGKFDYLDFSMYAGIVAALRGKPWGWISRSLGRAAQLGYPAPRELFDDQGILTDAGRELLSQRTDRATPLTEKQWRMAVDRLVGRGLLFRVTQGPRRKTLYSIGKNSDEIVDAIIKRESKSAPERAASLRLAEWRKQRAAKIMNGEPPKKPDPPVPQVQPAPTPVQPMPTEIQQSPPAAQTAAIEHPQARPEFRPQEDQTGATSENRTGNSETVTPAENTNPKTERVGEGLGISKPRSLEEVEACARKSGVESPEAEAKQFWLKHEAEGWTARDWQGLFSLHVLRVEVLKPSGACRKA